MKKRYGLLVSKVVEESTELGEEFMESPEAFAEKYGIESLECPREAHEAFKRGERAVAAVQEADLKPNSESMPALREIMASHLGKDFSVALIPFGLKFKERVDPTISSATGSGKITWLDFGGDVDV